MFSKKLYNKLSRVLLSVLILNLTFWNLLLVPVQTQAKLNTLGNYSCDVDINGKCYSCNSDGQCAYDANGPYTCSGCFSLCSITTTSEVPGTSSGGCGSAPITDVYIVGSSEQSAAEAAAEEEINSLEDLANATGLIDEAKQSLIDLINQNKPIPENLKEFIISAIENSTDISDTIKETLINLINQNKAIPDALKDIVTTMIENLENAVELVKNKFLDLILAGLDIESICKQLSNAATALPWAGVAIATAITFACPPLLHDFLTALGLFKEKLKTGATTQILPVPTLRYYKWEIGIPGFIKPGQYTEFK